MPPMDSMKKAIEEHRKIEAKRAVLMAGEFLDQDTRMREVELKMELDEIQEHWETVSEMRPQRFNLLLMGEIDKKYHAHVKTRSEEVLVPDSKWLTAYWEDVLTLVSDSWRSSTVNGDPAEYENAVARMYWLIHGIKGRLPLLTNSFLNNVIDAFSAVDDTLELVSISR